jgi:hypothetical protein
VEGFVLSGPGNFERGRKGPYRAMADFGHRQQLTLALGKISSHN